jgi:RNA recognition motif-containing protein
MNIFVAKLNFSTSSEELQALFEQFGTVESAKVIMDHQSGKSKGFGFVEMSSDAEAQAAIDALDQTEFMERTIVVKEAKPKDDYQKSDRKPYGGGGNRGGGGFNRGGGSGYGNNNRGGSGGGKSFGGGNSRGGGYGNNSYGNKSSKYGEDEY